LVVSSAGLTGIGLKNGHVRAPRCGGHTWARGERAGSGRNALSPEKRHIHIFMPAPKIGSGESRSRSLSARATANRISYRIPEISVEIGVKSMAGSRNKVEAVEYL
jgi:hypothetical protein